MKERILEFLRAENRTSAQFAEEIGVQPSGISHILSGRNNPSLDFVLKMLETYDYISTEWLLFGKGNMYKDELIQKTLDYKDDNIAKDDAEYNEKTEKKSENHLINKDINSYTGKSRGNKKIVEKIVWFYSDNSFEEYFPDNLL